jgi:SAM-dependent methyltransferase
MAASAMEEFDFVRYLRAKRSVDDRAMNPRVWTRLEREVAAIARPIDVLDAGAGVGTAAERMRDWSLIRAGVRSRYCAVEPRTELLHEARHALATLTLDADFVASEIEEFASREDRRERFDLVIAHALLDILDLESSLEALIRLLRRGGLLYLPITYDGHSSFEPARAEDEAVLSAYHGTMPRRGETGRLLYHGVRRRGLEVLEVGSSDWVVHPLDGAYPADEAYFLRFILATIDRASRGKMPAQPLASWIAERRRQIDEAQLVYCAHQFDLLARLP